MEVIINIIINKRLCKIGELYTDLKNNKISYEDYQKFITEINNKKLPIKPIFKHLKLKDFKSNMDIKDRYTATPEELQNLINYISNFTIEKFMYLHNNILCLSKICDLLNNDLTYFEVLIDPLIIKVYSPTNVNNIGSCLIINFEKYTILNGSTFIFHSVKVEDSYKHASLKIYKIIKVYLN